MGQQKSADFIGAFFYVTSSSNTDDRPLRRTLQQHIANQQKKSESREDRKSVVNSQ